MGLVQHPGRAEPRPDAPGPREGGREQVLRARLGRPAHRRLLRELHGRGGHRGGRRVPAETELDAIDRIASQSDLQAEIARLQTLGSNAVFQFTAEQDRKSSTDVIAIATQGGLGLPDRDYYTKTDDASKTLRNQYAAHLSRMFQLLGESAAAAEADAKTVMALETRLAQASMTRVSGGTRTRRTTATIRRARGAHAEFLLDGVLPPGRRLAPRRSTSRSRRSSRP